MNLHFIDDDYAINRYHELTLNKVASEDNIKLEFHDNPPKTLEMYSKSEYLPDLIFLDINMPVIDGWEFLDLFNEQFPDAKTKFIILTTSNNPKHQEKSKSYTNVFDFAIKPLKPDVFIKYRELFLT